MDHKKPIILNNLEEWDFIDYIDSLIQKEETVDLEFKIAKDGLPNSLMGYLFFFRQYRWGNYRTRCQRTQATVYH